MEIREYALKFKNCIIAVETEDYIDTLIKGKEEKDVLQLFALLIKAYAEQSGRYSQDVLEDVEMTMIEGEQ